jgi:general secretion pathway protein D
VLAADPSYVPQAGTSGLSPSTGSMSMSGLSSTGGGLSGQQPAASNVAAAAQATSAGGSGGGNTALGGMIQPDAATNSLIITAPEPLYRNIRVIIDKLDSRRAQVIIETLMVEVNADKAAEFGIQFQSLTGLNSNDASVIGGTNFNSTNGGSNIIGAAQNLSSLGPGLNVGVVKGSITIPGIGTVTNLGFLARALETTAGGNILSRPNILTLDNEEAKFLVGQNLPFITGSFTQTTTGSTNPFQTYERKDVGLQLRVKPQISEGGTVKLSIYLEVSSVVPGTAAAGFITNKRSFESNLLVEDGDFVVLSGLIEDKSNTSVSKVPILGDLPLIGALFRYENRDRSKTNTMVFLRPTIVRNATTSTALSSDRYDYMQSQIAKSQQPDNPIFNNYNVDPATFERNANVKAGEAPAIAPVRPSDRVQLIELRSVGDANRSVQVVRELREAGYDAYWETVNTGSGETTRVRVAVDQGRQEIGSVMSALMARGLEPTLIKAER